MGLLIDFDSAIIRAADPKVADPAAADSDDGVAIVKERVWTVSVRLNCRETANGIFISGNTSVCCHRGPGDLPETFHTSTSPRSRVNFICNFLHLHVL
jgi:hypothetical protein